MKNYQLEVFDFRESDQSPLTTTSEEITVTITFESPVPLASVALPTNKNVKGFTIQIEPSGGDLVPYKDGKVCTKSM